MHDSATRASKARVAAATGSAQDKPILVPQILTYAEQSDARSISITSFGNWPADCRKYPDKAYLYVYAFLSTLQIKPTHAPQSGITWLELLILFEIRGGPPDLRFRDKASLLNRDNTKMRI